MSNRVGIYFSLFVILFMSAGPYCTCVAAGQDKDRAPFVDVRQFGAKGDGAADDTAAIQAAADTIKSGTLYFPPGTYLCRLSIRRDGIAVRGSGSASTVLRMPPGVDGNVLELGDTAAGNDAPPYQGISVSGLTLDGNRASTPAPASDLTGWGMPMTRVSRGSFSDVRAINCWNGGVGVFIDSNCNIGDFHVINCGNTRQGTPGFDINSSKCCVFSVISEDCLYGARVLDNCIGNQLTMAIFNPRLTGLVCNSQLITRGCTNNQVRVTVTGGAADQAVLIGPRWFGNIFDISIARCQGKGVYIEDPGPNTVMGTDGGIYACIKDHTAGQDTRPVTGKAWQTFWKRTGRSGDKWRPDTPYLADNKAWGNLVNEATRTHDGILGLAR